MSKPRVNLYEIPKSVNQKKRIENALELLDLGGMQESFNNLAQRFIRDNSTIYDFLEGLLEKELLCKEEYRLQNWIKQAGFPWKKTLDDFDFKFQPGLNEKHIRELASCRFIEEAENVAFFGPPGVGKTHLAVALGLEAIHKGYSVRFITLEKLLDKIEKLNVSGKDLLFRFFAALLRPKLLILDEMDLHEASNEASDFLFKLLANRYEKGSLIFTSNKPFSAWEVLFKNKVRTETILDRIVQHCTTIQIEGESYRLKDKIKWTASTPKLDSRAQMN